MKNFKRLVIGLVVLFSAIAFVPAMAFPWQEKINWQNYAMIYQQPIVFYVNSPVDDFDDSPGDGICATIDGLCTLRAAIQEAQAIEKINADVTVEVPAGYYNLTKRSYPSSPFHIVVSRYNPFHVIIHGQGPEKTFIQGDSSSGIFKVQYSAIFSGLTIQNGNLPGGNEAGGITIDNNSEAIIVNCVLRYNQGGEGGAVKANYQSYLTLIETTISDNTATSGGGIFSYIATTHIQRSTVSRNSASQGGGIYISGSTGDMTLENSTISGNSSQSGGGIYNTDWGIVNIFNSTITENTAGDSAGGIRTAGNYGSDGGTVTLANTILAGNHQAGTPDCLVEKGVLVSIGYNLVGNTTGCAFTPNTGDKTNVSPGLAPLKNNGGPTQTHALLFNSPAVDGGNPAGCRDAKNQVFTLDQRRSPRPVEGNRDQTALCDIGAFETRPLYGIFLPSVRR